ncbi:uncharacterized protein LOC135953851 [Calliphora vicina]|uniref:uncharacterized protein LOC135953851 n=1 Tax=Calliphora vicina TaxID=7373 RepID=UPI00325AF90D
MAQNHDFDQFIDVDNTTINPSPQRVRNILTLEEKVAVIHAYDQRPMYKKVARMFNCSWEQIKNIVTNRTAVMDFYNETKSKKEKIDADHEMQMDLKQRKMKFLGECVYESIQRVQYHAKLPITEELIKHKALEFQDVLRIPGFSPTKKWLNLFKATYNISLSNKQISIYTKPQHSLDIKDIMTYCTKVKTGRSLLTKYSKDDVKNVEYETKRLRKLNFLQEALKEYSLRVKFHHKSMKLDPASLRRVAREFNEILKVQDFEPTTEWTVEFNKLCDREEDLTHIKRPPLSLDLKDILSYCSRMQNKAKDNTVTLTPKETALQMRVMPKYPGKNVADSGLKFQQNPIIYLDEEGAGEKDVKPDINEIRVERPHQEQPPPLKIRKIESINNDPELQRKFQTSIELRKMPTLTIREMPKEPAKPPAKTIIYIQKVPAIAPKENILRLAPQPENVQIKEESLEDNNYILPTNTLITTPPQLRIQKVHQQLSPSYLSPPPQQQQHYPPQPSSYKSEDNDHEDLPRHVTSFRDVLLLLKPLEEYAMLKENYRAIGLITQLEEVLKNDPEAENTGDEEFIG